MTKDSEEFTGQRLPGTGGDFIDENDVEGHRRYRGDDEMAPRKDGETGIAPRKDGETGFYLKASADDLDVEGHQRYRGDDELYRGGPSTQGEIVRRGPGDNPHGDK